MDQIGLKYYADMAQQKRYTINTTFQPFDII